MSYRTYIPNRGDLVHLNFSPSAGHEMADRHYALVLSPLSYNRRSRMAIVCSITSSIRKYPFEIPLPQSLLPDKRGIGPVNSVIVADSVRQVDYRQREIQFIAKAPPLIVEEAIDMLLSLLEED